MRHKGNARARSLSLSKCKGTVEVRNTSKRGHRIEVREQNQAEEQNQAGEIGKDKPAVASEGID